MNYDPRNFGARCESCPLGPEGPLCTDGHWTPVGPEIHDPDADGNPTKKVLAVVEMPGPKEVDEALMTGIGRPLVDKAGETWGDALRANGLRRPDVDLANVLECRIDGSAGGQWHRMESKLSRLNKARIVEGRAPWLHPMTCCAPRLNRLLEHYDSVITLGRKATQAVTGHSAPIGKLRGTALEVGENGVYLPDKLEGEERIAATRWKVAPTWAPGFIRRSPGWRWAWEQDIAKALMRFASNELWQPSDVVWRPTPVQLIEWLSQPAPFTEADIETSGIEPLRASIRTVSLTIPDLDAAGQPVDPAAEPHLVAQNARTIATSLLSADGVSRFYTGEDERLIRNIFRWAFDPDTMDETAWAWIRHVWETFIQWAGPTWEEVQRIWATHRIWTGFNFGYFDKQFIERPDEFGGLRIHRIWERLFAARGWNPMIPKGLKTQGTIWTMVPGRWDLDDEGKKVAMGQKGDDPLLTYNIVDTEVGARTHVGMVGAAAKCGLFDPLPEYLKPEQWLDTGREWTKWDVDHWLQEQCCHLHRKGLWVPQPRRLEMMIQYEKSVFHLEKHIGDMVGEAYDLAEDDEATSTDERAFNPGSANQLRSLMFEDWQLDMPPSLKPKEYLTKSGLYSTSDHVIRSILAYDAQYPNLTDQQRAVLTATRLLRRRKNKVIGTGLRPMRMEGLDQPYRLYYEKKVRPGIVWQDAPHGGLANCLHSDWKAHTTAVGRLACSRLNVQNVIPVLKELLAAHPGYYFMYGDINQAHLRLHANFWQIPGLLEAFYNGWDPYGHYAYMDLGKGYSEAQGWEKVGGYSPEKKPPSGTMAHSIRHAYKVQILTGAYGGSPDTIWGAYVAAEGIKIDVDGKPVLDEFGLTIPHLPYMTAPKSDTRRRRRKQLRREPQWEAMWEAMLTTHDEQGYISDPLSDRRTTHGVDEPNKIINDPILKAEAMVARIIEIRLNARWPHDFEGPCTGWIHQCHDSFTFQFKLPADIARRDPFWKPTKAMKKGLAPYPPSIALRMRQFAEDMTVTIPGWPIPFTPGPIGVGRNLKDVD